MTSARQFVRALLRRCLFCALAYGLPVWAQQEPLTSLAELSKLTPAEARTQRRPVALRAIHVAPGRFTARSVIFQGPVSASAFFSHAAAVPPANCEVELTGVTRSARFRGNDEVAIEVHTAKVMAQNVTPEPRRVPLEELADNLHRDRWVEIEGTVLQMRLQNGDLIVALAGQRDSTSFFFRGLPDNALPADWNRSRLRVRGLALGSAGGSGRLAVHGAMNVNVVQGGPDDAFATTEVKAGDLLKAASGSSSAARFTATVLHQSDNRQWLRTADGTALLASLWQPWQPELDAPHLTSAVPPVPVLHTGDVVELTGFPLSDGEGLLMRYCHVRVLSGDGLAAPVTADAAALARGRQRHELATVRGRLATQGFVTLQPGQQYEGVRLAAVGAELEIYYQSPTGGQLPRFSPDDLIEATGLVVAGAQPGTGRLMLRSPQDIRSLGLAPEVATLRRWRTIAIFVGSALLAAGIILALRRRLVTERALAGEVRSLNATLETRVAERTSELEKARAALDAALQEEREVGELKSRFVSTVSHEFRTPLGVIMSATDILSRYRTRITPDRMEEHLTEIREATRHMSGLMEDVLLLSRADAGRVPIQRQPLDLAELCHRLADETRSAVAQTGATHITSDLPPDLLAVDETLFRHIFTNLLGNAVKYSPPGAAVRVHLHREGPHAVITVTDQGIGIPEEDARRLFQPFARATNVGDRPGSGLGLVIVKRCAELHGGSVTFTSAPGLGTVFTVRLSV